MKPEGAPGRTTVWLLERAMVGSVATTMSPKLLRLGSLILLSVGPVLVLPAVAAAAPTVTFAPEFTSGQLGGPGSVSANLKVAGTEYGGFPPPISEIVLRLPAGTTIAQGDHPTCSTQVLEQAGPSGCYRASKAGSVGEVSAIVSFGSERVEEQATLESFFAPEGRLDFFVNGHSPVSLEMIGEAAVAGNVITIQVPLVATVPGAPYASISAIGFRLGETEAEEAASQLVSGLTLPATCPTGRVSWSSTVTFDEGGSNPVEPEPTEQAAESECLQRQEALRSQRVAEAQARRHAEEEAAQKRRAEEAELVTLRALVKQLQQELGARVKLERVKITRHGLLVTVKTSEPGVVAIAGPGLKGLVKELPAGVHRLTISFTRRGRAERGRHRRIKLLASERVDNRTVTNAVHLAL